jgi:hypothetical protein
MIDGYEWEKLIKAQLPFLNKFEFYVSFRCFISSEEYVSPVLVEIMAPLCTPFWMVEKRWVVICNYFPTGKELEIYTSPICKSCYDHVFDSKMKTISNIPERWRP